MRKLNLDSVEALAPKVRIFIQAIIFLPKGKWAGRERPVIHKLFPDDLIRMFKNWWLYEHRPAIKIIMNDEDFFFCFETELRKLGFTVKRTPSKQPYILSHGGFRYHFSSLRLTNEGYKLYINLLPKSDEEWLASDFGKFNE
jgi:hypothetical protein